MLPYKCLHYCSRASQELDILLCASSHNIYSFDNVNGKLLSKWPPSPASQWTAETAPGFKSYARATNPTLREYEEASGMLKFSPEVAVNPSLPRSYELDRVLSMDRSTAVVLLAATSNSQYIIAVTDEDKCIRVLELQDDGSLVQRCARYFSKF